MDKIHIIFPAMKCDNAYIRKVTKYNHLPFYSPLDIVYNLAQNEELNVENQDLIEIIYAKFWSLLTSIVYCKQKDSKWPQIALKYFSKDIESICNFDCRQKKQKKKDCEKSCKKSLSNYALQLFLVLDILKCREFSSPIFLQLANFLYPLLKNHYCHHVRNIALYVKKNLNSKSKKEPYAFDYLFSRLPKNKKSLEWYKKFKEGAINCIVEEVLDSMKEILIFIKKIDMEEELLDGEYSPYIFVKSLGNFLLIVMFHFVMYDEKLDYDIACVMGVWAVLTLLCITLEKSKRERFEFTVTFNPFAYFVYYVGTHPIFQCEWFPPLCLIEVWSLFVGIFSGCMFHKFEKEDNATFLSKLFDHFKLDVIYGSYDKAIKRLHHKITAQCVNANKYSKRKDGLCEKLLTLWLNRGLNVKRQLLDVSNEIDVFKQNVNAIKELKARKEFQEISKVVKELVNVRKLKLSD